MIISDYIIKRFPDGTPHIIRVKQELMSKVIWQYESMNEFFDVLVILSHLKAINEQNVELYMPYVPNARMDRSYSSDEVVTLKYFAQAINALDLHGVYGFDTHSAVTRAVFNHFYELSPNLVISAVIDDAKPNALYFPDEGAVKRYSHLGCISGYKAQNKILYGQKTRDWNSGKVLNLDIVGKFNQGDSILMIDDICSSGSTMHLSATKLKEMGAGEINMYVSHCENTILGSKLLNEPDLINRVYTTNSMVVKPHEKIYISNIL